jgi:hypothetical protein
MLNELAAICALHAKKAGVWFYCKLAKCARYAALERAFSTTSSAVGGLAGCQLKHRGIMILSGRGEPSVEK